MHGFITQRMMFIFIISIFVFQINANIFEDLNGEILSNVEDIDDIGTLIGNFTEGTRRLTETSLHDPTTNEIVVCLNPGYNENDAKSLEKRHKAFKYDKRMVFGTKEFYVFKINEEERKTEIDVDSWKDDPDIRDLTSEEVVKNVQIQRRYHLVLSNFTPQEKISPTLWHVNGIIKPSMKIEEAWDKGFTGKGVYIGVVDQAVDTNHYDLIGSVDTNLSFNYAENDSDVNPAILSLYHGTAVTGMIVSKPGNDRCSVGVAFNSTIVSIVIFQSDFGIDLTEQQLATYLTHASGSVDIYSNSWNVGGRIDYVRTGDIIEAAFENAILTGRKGKGAIYVFSAGNGGRLDNANADGFMTSPYTIVVSAVDKENLTTEYALVGSNIMAVAYGGQIKTTPLDGMTFPIPFSSCHTGFAGTSYSTPLVSGAIALALEASPDLSWRGVQHLLARTSQRYDFVDGGDPPFEWQENGAGLWTHPMMGFGLIDAEGMVQAAEMFTDLPEMITYSTRKETLVISTNSKAKCSKIWIKPGACRINYLENVLVNVVYNYTAFRGSVELNLYSPMGTKNWIMTERPEDFGSTPNAGTFEWTYRTLQTWGENPGRNKHRCRNPWRLEFRSTVSSVTVTLLEWTLTLYGTETSPT